MDEVFVTFRTRAESLSGRPTSTAVGAPPLASQSGVRRMDCGDVCLLTDEGGLLRQREYIERVPARRVAHLGR